MPASAAYVCHYVGPMFGVSRFVMESGRCYHEYELPCGDATGIGLESGKLCKLIRKIRNSVQFSCVVYVQKYISFIYFLKREI